MNPASYSFWAMLIVWLTENLSFLAASCCRDDVVNGGAGTLSPSFLSMLVIENLAPMHLPRNSPAFSMSGNLVSSTAFTVTPSGVPSGWNMASTL